MGRLRKNVIYEKKLFSDNEYFIAQPNLFNGKWNKSVFKNNNPIEVEIGLNKAHNQNK